MSKIFKKASRIYALVIAGIAVGACSGGDGQFISSDTGDFQDPSRLSSLFITGYESNRVNSVEFQVEPSFDPFVLTYDIELPNELEAFTVTPTVADAATSAVFASDDPAGSVPTTSGEETATFFSANPGETVTVYVRVRATDGTSVLLPGDLLTAAANTYQVNVTRAPSKDVTLSSLEVTEALGVSNNLLSAFAPATIDYSLEVRHPTTALDFRATANDPLHNDVSLLRVVDGVEQSISNRASGARVRVDGLSVGSNPIIVRVTAQDTEFTQDYTVNITRYADSSLSALSVSEGALLPEFSAETTAYTVGVANNVTGLTVTPSVSDSNASVTVNGTEVESGSASASIALEVGANTIDVEVTASDATTTQYTITVNRNSDSSLSSLLLSAGILNPVFDRDVTTYNTTVDFTDANLTVTPTVNDSGARVSVNGVEVASGSASGAIGLNVGVNVIGVVVTASNNTSTTYTVNVTRRADARLSALALSAGSLSPAFNADTTAYSATVANGTASLTVTPTVANAAATVTVNGETVNSGEASGAIALSVGSNTITVLVTASDATTTTYSVTVTREADTTLRALSLSAGSLSPVFNGSTLNYSATVENNVDSITVTPTLNGIGATVTVNGTEVDSGEASGAIALNVGSNTVTVVVTASDATTTTYSVTVTREADSGLSSLVLSQGTLLPAFESDTTAYSTTVANGTASLTVTPTVANAAATVTVNGTAVNSGEASGAIALNVGSNTITVLVTASDATTTTYSVTVTREADTTLRALSLSAGSLSPVFNGSTLNYSATVENNVDSITVTPTLNGVGATVTVNGTAVSSGEASGAIALNVGSNTVTVVVTASDATTTTYSVTVTREADSRLSGLTFALVGGGSIVTNLSPNFNPDTTEYWGEVNSFSEAVRVTPTVRSPGATVTVNDTDVNSGSASQVIQLGAYESNTFIDLRVTATDGTTTDYRLRIYRVGDPQLSNLVLSAGILSPEFMSNISDYDVTVAHAVENLTITPSAVTEGTTVRIGVQDFSPDYGNAIDTASDPIPLAVGEQTIVIRAISNDTRSTRDYRINVTRQADSSLSDLTLSEGALSPAFDSSTLNYSATVENNVDSITVTPTLNSSSATVTVNGTEVESGAASGAIALNVGSTTVTVIVTASDATTTTYSVTVTREADTSLRALSLSAGSLSPVFNGSTLNYSATVENNVDSITVTPTLNSSSATVTVNGTEVDSGEPSDAIALNVGSNSLNVVVSADDGSSTTYTVGVTREADPSRLSGLTFALVRGGGIVTNLSPNFNPDTTEYWGEVISHGQALRVTPTVRSPGATVTVNDTEVDSGSASQDIQLGAYESNTFIDLRVTATDGTTTDYRLRIYRIGNSRLSNLVLSAGTLSPGFSYNLHSYSVTVANTVESLTITPSAVSEGTRVEIGMEQNGVQDFSTDYANAIDTASDPIPLAVGEQTILIRATSNDRRNFRYYRINVTRLNNVAFLEDDPSLATRSAYQNNDDGTVGDDPTDSTVTLVDPTPGAKDHFGQQVLVLGNGHIAVSDPNDSSEEIIRRGAVHLYSSDGTRIASHYGERADDQFGSGGLLAHAGDDSQFIVLSPNQSRDRASHTGAIHLYDGIDGTLLASRYGEQTEDYLGDGGATALANGHIAVLSRRAADNLGSFELLSGANLSVINARYGQHADDYQGEIGVVSLNDTVALVLPQYDSAKGVDVGRVALLDADTGESLGDGIEGEQTSDYLGLGGVTAVGDNLAIASPWHDGLTGVVDAGRVTLIDGRTGAEIDWVEGEQADDQLGYEGVVASSDGQRYYIVSSYYDNGEQADAGQIQIRDSVTGLAQGAALIGSSAGERLGSGGVSALGAEGLVIASPEAAVAGNSQAGRVELRSGSLGENRVRSHSGRRPGERLGSGAVTGVGDNVYVIASPEVGAGQLGQVQLFDANSGDRIGSTLKGVSAGDALGSGGIYSLRGVRYLILSPSEQVNGVEKAGTARLVDASSNVIQSTVRGNRAGDLDGAVFSAQQNGDYTVVGSPNWDTEAGADAGQVVIVRHQ